MSSPFRPRLREAAGSAKTILPKPGGKLLHARIAFVIGTRPEAIKLAPVAHALAARGQSPRLFITGQHPGLEPCDHGLGDFAVTPLDCPGQPDPMLHARMVQRALKPLMDSAPPQLLVVQGDTSSALGGALAAWECGVRLGHVEAGLRSHDARQPWPEESNRVAIDRISHILFAPTAGNAANLAREGVNGTVHVTGNSGIDALARIVGDVPLRRRKRWRFGRGFRLLVTCHRRENWDEGLTRLIAALIELQDQGITIDMVLPPNPSVTRRVVHLLGARHGINIRPPLTHSATVAAMLRADVILSDSGGIQEEAPALGVPLIVLREKTERPEGIESGSMVLAGTDRARIVAEVLRLRRDRAALAAMSIPCLPFGDGRAAVRIAEICLDAIGLQIVTPRARTA